MLYTHTQESRHFNYLCHVVSEMESRYGAADEMLTPLLSAKENEKCNSFIRQTYLRIDRSEHLGSVIKRYWGLRQDRLWRS